MGAGFMSTRFGQTAIQLDSSGTLKRLGMPQAKVRVVSQPKRG